MSMTNTSVSLAPMPSVELPVRAEGVLGRDDREHPAAELLAESDVSRPGSSCPTNSDGVPEV